MDYESSHFQELEDIINFQQKFLKEVSNNLSGTQEIKKIENFAEIEHEELLKNYETSGAPENMGIEEYTSKLFDKDGVYIKRSPSEKVTFFYNDNGQKSDTFDLIKVDGLEISTGGMRDINRESVESKMKEININLKKYKPYLMMLESAPTHGGFGIGLERLVATMTGKEDIRDILSNYRDPENISDDLRWNV